MHAAGRTIQNACWLVAFLSLYSFNQHARSTSLASAFNCLHSGYTLTLHVLSIIDRSFSPQALSLRINFNLKFFGKTKQSLRQSAPATKPPLQISDQPFLLIDQLANVSTRFHQLFLFCYLNHLNSLVWPVLPPRNQSLNLFFAP